MNNPPDPHSAREDFDRRADRVAASPFFKPHDGAPRDYEISAANDQDPPPYPFLTRIVIIGGLIAATWGFLWIVIRGGLKLAGVL